MASGESVPRRASRPEVPSLTSVRGYLASWVVVYHFWDDVVRLFPASRVLTPWAEAGWMAVPAFFILSGYVLTYNYGDSFDRLNPRFLARFWFLRLARIYPVHLVTLLAVAAMVIVARRMSLSLDAAGYSGRDFVLNLFLVQTWVPHFRLNWNYPAWSISSEWFAYLWFPFVARWSHGLSASRKASWIAVIVTLMAAIALYRYGQEVPFQQLLSVIPTFLLGMALHSALRGTEPPRGISWRYLPELFSAALIATCFAPSWAIIALNLTCTVGLIASLAWLRDRCSLTWRARAAVFLGEVSYSLYMTHTIAQKLANELLPSTRFVHSSAVTKCGVLAAYLATIVAGTLGSYYLVERPARQLVRKLTRRG